MSKQQNNASLKTKLLSAKDVISKYASEIQKLAQDMDMNGGGTLGPDQVKEILQGVSENLGMVQNKIQEVAEGVPATEGEPEEPENPEAPEPDEMIAAGDKGEKGSKKAVSETDKLREEVASLKERFAKEDKEKLANDFASYFPLSQRQAKYNEIMQSKDSLQILQAKLDGIKSINQTRIASRRDNIVHSPEKTTIFKEEGGAGQRSASMGTQADLTDI